jgi:hypothetical protein
MIPLQVYNSLSKPASDKLCVASNNSLLVAEPLTSSLEEGKKNLRGGYSTYGVDRNPIAHCPARSTVPMPHHITNL